MLKKSLYIVLVVVMLVSMMYVPVFAADVNVIYEEGLRLAIANATPGDTMSDNSRIKYIGMYQKFGYASLIELSSKTMNIEELQETYVDTQSNRYFIRWLKKSFC